MYDTHQRREQDVFMRYLDLLEVSKRSSSFDTLKELIAAQMTRVPFENISKLYYRKRLGLNNIPDMRTYLDGIERFHFGGTCYSNNYYFYLLLANLGYAAKLCGADMNNPDAHMAIMVGIEGREFLVDVGYAAPFLSPLPRDLAEDHTILLGRDRYVLRPQDSNGCSRLELYRDGKLKHGYLAKPAPKQIEDFSIADSFRADATFMNALLLARTIRRAATQEELWNGNREKFWWHLKLWSQESLFHWLFKTYWRRKREYPMIFAYPEHSHLKIIRFQTPREAEDWLDGIAVT